MLLNMLSINIQDLGFSGGGKGGSQRLVQNYFVLISVYIFYLISKVLIVIKLNLKLWKIYVDKLIIK